MRGLARLSVLRERAGYRSLAADEEHCLHALAVGGATLAQLGELLLEQEPPGAPPKRAVQRLAVLLDLWASDELLTSHSSRSNG